MIPEDTLQARYDGLNGHSTLVHVENPIDDCPGCLILGWIRGGFRALAEVILLIDCGAIFAFQRAFDVLGDGCAGVLRVNGGKHNSRRGWLNFIRGVLCTIYTGGVQEVYNSAHFSIRSIPRRWETCAEASKRDLPRLQKFYNVSHHHTIRTVRVVKSWSVNK